jgi:tryptophan halogenase
MKKLCIVGTGAAGWMTCLMAAEKNLFEQIIIIGSPSIPSIGVGESNTLAINNFHKEYNIDLNEFIRESDAAVKYGVYYKNWGKNNFINNFRTDKSIYDILGIPPELFYSSLANKSKDVPISDLVACDLIDTINKNHIFKSHTIYPKSWHFDAGKYIEFISKHCKKYKNVSIISETVTKVEKTKDKIEKIITDKNNVIQADYYVISTGYSDILNEEYNDLSDILLTDKAFVYPLEYTNKREQFHPYTVAKTMKYGWRWITPTYSRIGTGYTFSSRYVSVDEARQEFINDIGVDIEPKLVNFQPRYNKKTFKENYCTIGLSNGFLEPLDAPGLSLTIKTIYNLERMIVNQKNIPDTNIISNLREVFNKVVESNYKYWAAFILTQYKTCWRDDTQFWIDHKKIKYDHQEYIMSLIENFSVDLSSYIMFMITIAGKDCTWNSKLKSLPFKQPENSSFSSSIHHLDYIETIRKIKLSFC